MGSWKCDVCGWSNAGKWSNCANCGLARDATDDKTKQLKDAIAKGHFQVQYSQIVNSKPAWPRMTNRSCLVIAVAVPASLIGLLYLFSAVFSEQIANVFSSIEYSHCYSVFEYTTWVDVDRDGSWDPEEYPLPGVEISLSGEFDETIITGNDGTGVMRQYGPCPSMWLIQAQGPEHLTPTTETRIETDSPGEFDFGYAR